MKKILIAFAVLLLIFFAATYIFIPSTLNISVVAKTNAPVNGVFRVVSNESIWPKWLHQSNDFIQEKITAADPFLNKIDVTLYKSNDSIKTIMHLLDLVNDSMAVQWDCMIKAGSNPFARISNYNKAIRLKKDMDGIVSQLKMFISKDENVYGFPIQETTTKDSMLISAKTKLTNYPSTNDIYKLIDVLKNYAIKSGAQITNYPMYNVTKINSDTLRLMVALPVDKKLKQTDSISIIEMVKGKFLICEVTGGNESIKNALQQMQYYFAEHNRTSMAITFNYLVTDRQEQPDTSKWITRIYAPVY